MARKPSHGMSRTRFYKVWSEMKRRCYKEDFVAYKNYGGRGITVCDKWNDFSGFKEDMYESYLKHAEEHGEKNTTLERIDSNGNYTIDNCEWATRQVQCLNRRNTKIISYQGKDYTVKDFCERFNLDFWTVYGRLRRGWSMEEVLNNKKNKHRKRGTGDESKH